MTYMRVIPRDLFNEANLLKCHGALWIALDNMRDHKATFGDGTPEGDYGGAPFDIDQDQDGSTFIRTIDFRINGERYYLTRPLNSRENWPLYCVSTDGDNEWSVFNDDGTLSDEFKELIS